MTISRLPPIPALNWETARTPDGRVDTVAPVTQEPLRRALEGDPAPSGVRSLVRFLNRHDRPQVDVSPRTFALLKDYEPVQQRVSQLVGDKANTVVGITASGGGAIKRMQMADAETLHTGQYSLERAHGTVQYGAGVCVTVNNVLFRATAEMTGRRALGTRPQPGTPMFRDRASQQMPVYFQVHAGHGYVRIGDIRVPDQARDAVVGDVWDTLPIVKTWDNFVDTERPASTRFEVRPGELMDERNSLASFSRSEAMRVAPDAVDAALAADGSPQVGPALVARQYEELREKPASRRGLYHEPTLARQPTLSYRNAETGEIFTPSIAIHDYQKARVGMEHPRFRQFLALTEPEESSDARLHDALS